MAFDFHWYDRDHTVIRIDIYGDVTWEQLHITLDTMIEEITNTPHRVDVIFNDQVGLPKGNPIPHLKLVITRLTAHPNMGLLVAASPKSLSSVTKMMVDTVMRIYQINMSHYGGFCDTLDCALETIAKDRAKKITYSR